MGGERVARQGSQGQQQQQQQHPGTPIAAAATPAPALAHAPSHTSSMVDANETVFFPTPTPTPTTGSKRSARHMSTTPGGGGGGGEQQQGEDGVGQRSKRTKHHKGATRLVHNTVSSTQMHAYVGEYQRMMSRLVQGWVAVGEGVPVLGGVQQQGVQKPQQGDTHAATGSGPVQGVYGGDGGSSTPSAAAVVVVVHEDNVQAHDDGVQPMQGVVDIAQEFGQPIHTPPVGVTNTRHEAAAYEWPDMLVHVRSAVCGVLGLQATSSGGWVFVYIGVCK